MNSRERIPEKARDPFVEPASLPISPSTAVAVLVTALVILQTGFGFNIKSLVLRAWHLYLAVLYRAQLALVGRLRRMDSKEVGSTSADFGQVLSGAQHSGGGFMAKVLGFGREGLLKRDLPLRGIGSLLKGMPRDVPPGLGNYDNSCYQNSVIQGLASLRTFPTYLQDIVSSVTDHQGLRINSELQEIIRQLNDPQNHGRRLWTPPKLKSMNSWQQQDAQEYFSKILDDVERETTKAQREKKSGPGFENLERTLTEDKNHALLSSEESLAPSPVSQVRNPLEGLLAQRVGCTECKYTEGFSMIPFNCLTLPLGRDWEYSVRGCLNEYTALEYIDGVECGKCTLLHTQAQLERLLSNSGANEAFHTAVKTKLDTIEEALENDDFSDNTLIKKCKIPKKQWRSSRKSRQAVIGRPPRSLVLHVNRSIFDEYTGAQLKNHARVEFQSVLDISSWCLGGTLNESRTASEQWPVDPTTSILQSNAHTNGVSQSIRYELRAAVTHYGRHENGHYICYRKHPFTGTEPTEEDSEVRTEDEKMNETLEHRQPRERWWRLSDDDVMAVSEEQVLRQPEVFMLFYERMPITSDCNTSAGSEDKVVEPLSDKELVLDTIDIADVKETAKQEIQSEQHATMSLEPSNDSSGLARLVNDVSSLSTSDLPGTLSVSSEQRSNIETSQDQESKGHDHQQTSQEVGRDGCPHSELPSTPSNQLTPSAECAKPLPTETCASLDLYASEAGDSNNKTDAAPHAPMLPQPLKMRTARVSHQRERSREGLRMVAAT